MTNCFRSLLGLLFGIVLLSTSVTSEAATGQISLLDSGSHCVAYKVRKRLLLLKKIWVVGKNCDVSSQVLPDLGELYYVETSIPVKQFKSGESERDRDVAKLLGKDRSDEMVFRSEKLKKAVWQERIKRGPFNVKGELVIAGKTYKVVARAQIIKTEQGLAIDGKLKVNMKKLGIKPPTMFLGLGAKVYNDVELHFHLLADRTLGVDSIIR